MKGKTIMFLLVGLLLAAVIVYAVTFNAVTIVSPTAGQNITGVFTLNSTTNDNVTNVTYVFNSTGDHTGANGTNVTVESGDNPDNLTWNTSYDTKALIDGLYNITFVAINASGFLENATARNVTIDNTNATVNIVGVNGTNSTGTAINITFNQTDNSTLPTTCAVFVNGTAATSNLTSATDILNDTVTVVALSSLAQGNVSVQVNCTDSVGNIGASNNLTYLVDNVGPSIENMTEPVDGNRSTGLVVFNFTVNDTTLPVAEVAINVTNGSSSWTFNLSNAVGDFWNITFNMSNFANERHNITVLANDSMGNNNTQTYFFVRDNTTGNVTMGDTRYDTDTASARISFTPNDNVSTTLNCTLYLDNESYGTNASVPNGTLSAIATNSTLTDGQSYQVWVSCMDNSDNNATPLTNSTLVVALPSGGTGGGGTGGGGGSSSTVQLTRSETTISLRSTDSIVFTAGGEQHSLKADSVGGGEATFTLESTPTTFTLKIGESKVIPIEKNEVVQIRLKSIAGTLASVGVKILSDYTPSVTTPTADTTDDAADDTPAAPAADDAAPTQPADESADEPEESSSNAGLWITLLVLVVIVGIVVWLVKKK